MNLPVLLVRIEKALPLSKKNKADRIIWPGRKPAKHYIRFAE
jgi:hypothetical protein